MRALVTLLMCTLAFPAIAQQQRLPCGPAAEMRATLANQYKEVEISGGLVGEEAYLSVFVSPDGATWTALMTSVKGVSCIVGAGQHWFQGEVPPTGDPA